MNNYDDKIFEFGNGNVNESEQSVNDFNYNSISGLGESNYENDDLFKPEDENTKSDELQEQDNLSFEVEDYGNEYQLNDAQSDFNEKDVSSDIENEETEKENNNDNFLNDAQSNFIDKDVSSDIENEKENNNDDFLNVVPVDYQIENLALDNNEEKNEVTEPKIEMSETPIEELKSLTDYKKDDIEKTDINVLFDKVSSNVKGASEIFKRNTEMKEKIDTRFEELKKLQLEIENSKNTQINEINEYKDEVFNKLTEKKEEIEKRLNILKDLQASLEKEKSEFEEYRKKEQDKIEKIKKDVQSAYDDRREELSHIEDTLRKQKDALDEERNQLSLDKIQYEAEKNELANNILKFNELVDTFTNGVNGVTE